MSGPNFTTPKRAPLEQLVQSIRSDDLPHFTGFLQQIAVFKNHVGVYQIDLILDANVVIRDLLWLAMKRTNPAARTSLMELMACQVVRAHAPHFLTREIKLNLPEVAEKMRVSVGLLRALWKEYRKQIRFVAVGGPAKGTKMRDPKDAPYLRLQRKLAYPIVSLDSDLPAMGGDVVHIQIFAPLRTYSRDTAIEYQLKVMGVGSVMVLGNLLVAVLQGLRNLPKRLLWGAVLLLALALVSPNARKKIFEIADKAFQGGAILLEGAFQAVGGMLREHLQAQNKAALYFAQTRASLPTIKVDGGLGSKGGTRPRVESIVK